MHIGEYMHIHILQSMECVVDMWELRLDITTLNRCIKVIIIAFVCERQTDRPTKA